MTTYRLWEGDAPGALGTAPSDIPVILDYGTARSEARPAIVVCPGGGYGGLADHEGEPIAHWFESINVRAFVLRYRLGPRYHHPTMLGDVHRAIRYVRAHASTLGVDSRRVGVLGFSAGGHLASTAVTLHDLGSGADPVESQSSRPNVGVLIYPVIQMSGPFTHRGSRDNLLGRKATEEQAKAVSSELNVALDTPPTFLVHSTEDTVVPVENSLMFATALSAHKVPFEMHVPEKGPHGFGMGAPGSPLDWRPALEKWLRGRKFL